MSPGGPDYDPGRPRGDYFLKRHILEEHDLYTGTGESYRRHVVFSLAELYLKYAEARNEAAGRDQTVYDAINTVRARVNMPALPAGLFIWRPTMTWRRMLLKVLARSKPHRKTFPAIYWFC